MLLLCYVIFMVCVLISNFGGFFYFLYILTYPRIRILGEMAYPRIAVSRTGIRIRVSGQHSSSGLTVKDSASRRPLLRCDSTGPFYTLRLPSSAAPLLPSSSSAVFAAMPSSTTWHRRLGHPGRDVLAQLKS